MTRADERAPVRAGVTDLAEARRRRNSAAPTPPDGAAEPAPDAGKSGAGASGAGAKPAARRRRDPANRRFDAVKVARLKREIDEGTYEIDCWSVTDRFIEHERNRH